MLPVENRLKKMRDFTLVLTRGRTVRSGVFSLRYLDLRTVPAEAVPRQCDQAEFRKQVRCAFAVGLKVSKKAVERNRLRRQLRAIIRPFIDNKRIREGVYLLCVGHASMRNMPFQEMTSLVEEALRKARVLREV